jgi:hypothetical protein
MYLYEREKALIERATVLQTTQILLCAEVHACIIIRLMCALWWFAIFFLL